MKRVTAPYKYPRVIEFVNELPKTISGKIRRVAIRATDAAKNATESVRKATEKATENVKKATARRKRPDGGRLAMGH